VQCSNTCTAVTDSVWSRVNVGGSARAVRQSHVLLSPAQYGMELVESHLGEET
jgi:hypothetical protein